MTPAAQLRLGFLLGTSAEWISAADAVKAVRHGRAPDIVLDKTVISLVVDGRERLAGLISWGPSARLASQFKAAATRLERGDLAVIRTARTDTVNGIWLAFHPDEDDVTIAVEATDRLPWAGWFPDDQQHGADFYEFVASHTRQARSADAAVGFSQAQADRKTMIKALRREADLAMELDGLIGS
jgi:hypothetical protein